VTTQPRRFRRGWDHSAPLVSAGLDLHPK